MILERAVLFAIPTNFVYSKSLKGTVSHLNGSVELGFSVNYSCSELEATSSISLSANSRLAVTDFLRFTIQKFPLLMIDLPWLLGACSFLLLPCPRCLQRSPFKNTIPG